MLIALAGDSVDEDLAKVMLESADWDVELALNGLFENQTPKSSQVPTTSPAQPGSTPDGDGASGEQFEGLAVEDLRALLDAYDVDHSTCTEKAELVKLLERTVGNGATQSQGAAPPSHFGMETAMFGDIFSDASTRASSGDEEDIPENWANRLKIICEKFPTTPRSQVVSLLKKHHGAACVVEHELQEMITAKEEQATQAAERQAEIAMQDQEYFESLLMDQAQEAQRKEEQQLRKAEEELLRQQQEETKKKLAEEAQAQREAEREAELAFEAKRSRVDQPEPDKAHPDRCQIVIRTPCGKRLCRTFLGSNEVSFIYDWVDVACSQEEFVKEPYTLVARLPGNPNKEISRSQKTFKDEGIEHQSVFMVSSS